MVVALSNIIPATTLPFTQVLAMLSLISIPVIAFSIYYQKFEVKTWCKLCLTVSTIMIAQFAFFTIGYWNAYPLIPSGIGQSIIQVISLALLFAGIALVIKLVKTTIEHSVKFQLGDVEGNRIKHSTQVFKLLLSQQRRIDTQPYEKEIRIGNRDANLQIIVVSNLHCKPCRERHQQIEQLLKMYRGDLSVTFRFVRSGKQVVDNLDSSSYLFGAWLSHAYLKADEQEQTMELLHNWFKVWDLEKFAPNWPISKSITQEILLAQEYNNAWIERTDIAVTPTIFLNGYELPREYGINDLLVMIPALSASIHMESALDLELKGT